MKRGVAHILVPYFTLCKTSASRIQGFSRKCHFHSEIVDVILPESKAVRHPDPKECGTKR